MVERRVIDVHDASEKKAQHGLNAKRPGRADDSQILTRNSNSTRRFLFAGGFLTGMALLASAGCGDVVVEKEGGNCSPIPDCPRDYDPFEDYLESQRETRRDPKTGQITQICISTSPTVICEEDEVDIYCVTEPLPLCKEDEDRENKNCKIPACEDATSCDPVPSRKTGEPKTFPDRSGLPTRTDNDDVLKYSEDDFANQIFYNAIFDNVADCEEGVAPDGYIYMPCDQIKTCDDDTQIKSCRTLPRCEENEPPVSCEKRTETNWAEIPNHEELCFKVMETTEDLLFLYGLGLRNINKKAHAGLSDITLAACSPGNNYIPPIIEIKCLPTPECQEGEKPQEVSRTHIIDCGEFGSVTNTFDKAASCDPIPDCPSAN